MIWHQSRKSICTKRSRELFLRKHSVQVLWVRKRIESIEEDTLNISGVSGDNLPILENPKTLVPPIASCIDSRFALAQNFPLKIFALCLQATLRVNSIGENSYSQVQDRSDLRVGTMALGCFESMKQFLFERAYSHNGASRAQQLRSQYSPRKGQRNRL